MTEAMTAPALLPEDVERVARAICQTDCTAACRTCIKYREHARAALSAMQDRRAGSESARADALEEAARKAEFAADLAAKVGGMTAAASALAIAAAIRALKDKPLPAPPEKADE